jgi:oxaloacetate decarboxylase gamma subunit
VSEERKAMVDDLIQTGLDLMLVGMGTVFAFLSLLVVAMLAMSRIVRHFSPAPAPAGVSDAQIAAMTVAIARHRGDA